MTMTPAPDRITHTLLCAVMLLVWYSITLLVSVLPWFPVWQQNGLLMPVLCLLEFAAIVPLYRWYQSQHHDIPAGSLRARQALLFSVLLLALIASQSLYMEPESWARERFTDNTPALLLFCFSVVVLAPVYEEILFRGFLMRAFFLWAPRQRLACSLLTSLLFAAIHTQYVHLQTLIALSLLSLLLCAARLVSAGLKLPVFLHMLNNLLGVLPLLWQLVPR